MPSVKRFSPEVVLITQAVSGSFRVLSAVLSTYRQAAAQLALLIVVSTKNAPVLKYGYPLFSFFGHTAGVTALFQQPYRYTACGV